MAPETNQLVGEFLDLLHAHGSRSQEVQDFLAEHPGVRRLIDEVLDREVPALDLIK